MASSSHHDAIMAVRESEADDGEPILERTRTVQADRDSIRSNLTAEGRDIVGLEPGDDVTVKIFHDMIVVVPEGSDVE